MKIVAAVTYLCSRLASSHDISHFYGSFCKQVGLHDFGCVKSHALVMQNWVSRQQKLLNQISNFKSNFQFFEKETLICAEAAIEICYGEH
jgi:hypothetical protein